MRPILVLVLFVGAVLFPAWPCQGAVTKNRLAGNRLAGNRLAANRLAGNRLAGNRLAGNQLAVNQLAATDLLATEEGREVLSYLLNCALPDGTTMEATVPGAPDSAPPETAYTCTNELCVFDGGLGLAPKWVIRRLRARERRWVSACVLARVNLFTTAEAVSLRGPHDALAVTGEEAALYTLAEGAFYGDIFKEEGEPIIWIACRGEGQAASESGGLNLRDCAEPDPDNPGLTECGFTWAGDCADYSPEFPSPYACKDSSAGYYEKCHEQPGAGAWLGIKKYREAITVFVSP
jgi:hypothetical protein